jgi:hypothetical protein
MLSDVDDPWIREALRLNDRYLGEVVVAFNLCPWADRALREGRVARRVLLAAEPRVEDALSFGDSIEPDPRMEIGLLICPRASLDAGAWHRFAGAVRETDRKRRTLGAHEGFALAAFHPDSSRTFETPHQLVAFIRRTPDPTLQFVRYSTLADARAVAPDVSDAVAYQNFETVEQLGAAKLDAILAGIRRDRDETYARLGA